MSDDKTPIEQAVDQALDAFVYAPIGLVFDGPALFPKLVEKGRTQVKVARMMGQMAVQMGQSEAEKRMARTHGPVREALAAFGVVAPETPASTNNAAATAPATETPATVTPAATKPAATKPTKKRPATRKRAATKARPAKKTATTRTRTPAKKSAAKSTPASLAIPDYDSLSASQVVKRLQGLDAADLDAVKAYESQTRGRKTILNRITQLQKD